MVLILMTLSDLWPRFQGHDIIQWQKNLKMAQDTAVLGMADQKKVVYALSSGAIFNDTEWPPTQTSR